MSRLTLDETSPSGHYARSAHIAAMGQRLAAAGPRTRQRVTQRYNPLVEPGGDIVEPAVPQTAERLPILVADRSHAFIRDVTPIVPPRARHRVFTAIGRAAALCIMATAGFALVLVAQSPRWSAAPHASAKKQSPAVVTKAEPEQPAATLPPPVSPAQLAEQDWGKSAQSPARQSEAPAPRVQTPSLTVPAALPQKTLPAAAPASIPPATRSARPAQVELAAAHRPGKGVHEAARREAPRPGLLAHYELPRWLTEDRPSPPHAIIMSPPPHDLEAPAAQQASFAAIDKPRFALPPLPRPRLIYASAAYSPVPAASYRPQLPYGYYRPYSQ